MCIYLPAVDSPRIRCCNACVSPAPKILHEPKCTDIDNKTLVSSVSEIRVQGHSPEVQNSFRSIPTHLYQIRKPLSTCHCYQTSSGYMHARTHSCPLGVDGRHSARNHFITVRGQQQQQRRVSVNGKGAHGAAASLLLLLLYRSEWTRASERQREEWVIRMLLLLLKRRNSF